MIQIDVIKKHPDAKHLYECNLYANGVTVKMYIHELSYEKLIESGFFIRDGKKEDSAGVLNTTDEYSISDVLDE